MNDKVAATKILTAFLDHWVIPYGTLSIFLTDDVIQFVNNMFAT